MCPIDLTEEEKEVLEVVEEDKRQEEVTEKAVEDIVEVLEEEVPEFEGVDKIEDIPKGKEKYYGI